MNRRKVNSGEAAARFFHFPSSLTWIGVCLSGVASRKVVCKIRVEIRVVLVRVCGLKKKTFFFRLLDFPLKLRGSFALVGFRTLWFRRLLVHKKSVMYGEKSLKKN